MPNHIEPSRIMVVLNVDLGDLSSVVTAAITKTGAVPAEFDDLLSVKQIEVGEQVRYIVNWL